MGHNKTLGKQFGYFEWDDAVGSPGHRNDGSYHQNLYNDEGKLAGHARFVPYDEPLDNSNEYSYENTFISSEDRRDSELENELAEAVLKLIVAGVIIFGPSIKDWWQGKAWPAVSNKAQKVRLIGRKKRPSTEVKAAAEDKITDVELDQRPIMSREEAMSRVIVGIAARVHSDQQFRMVKSARIVGVEDHPEIERAIAEIPAEKLQVLILEIVKNPSLLEDEPLANLASILTPKTRVLESSPEPMVREEPNA